MALYEWRARGTELSALGENAGLVIGMRGYDQADDVQHVLPWFRNKWILSKVI